MDITQYAVTETADIPLLSAAGLPILNKDGAPASITIYGPGSKPYKKAQSARQKRLMEIIRSGKDDDDEESVADLLADITVAFKNFEYKGLKGRELFKAVYADRGLGFIAERVNKFAGSWANFTQGSGTN